MRTVLMAAMACASLCAQATWYVDSGSLAGGNGTVTAPFLSIQAAMDVASPGGIFGSDTILVAPGTYSGSLDFLGKNVHVRGVVGADETTLLGAPGSAAVTFANGESAGAILEGFTISRSLEVQTPATWGAQALTSVSGTTQELRAVDVDGDGDRDLVRWTTAPDLEWSENQGGGVFGPIQSTFSHAWLTGFDLGDVDGDGDLDVLITSGQTILGGREIAWYEQVAGSSYVLHSIEIPGQTPLTPALADLDGDGLLDAVYQVGFELFWRSQLSSSPGTFGSAQPLGNLGWIASAVRAADIDGDGDSDLIAATAGSPFTTADLFTLENLGAGTFGGPLVAAALGDFAIIAPPSDVDGDGDHDLLVASGGQLGLFLGLPGGAFAPELVITSAGAPGAIATGDIDADGDLDIGYVLQDLVLHRNDGTGSWTQSEVIASNVTGGLALGDLLPGAPAEAIAESAGQLEIHSPVGATFQPLRGFSADGFTDVGAVELDSGHKAIVTLDLDDDGDHDVAWIAPATSVTQHRVLWAENDGGSFLPGALLFQVSGSDIKIQGLGVGDVDDDGVDELVVIASDLTLTTYSPVFGSSCWPDSESVLSWTTTIWSGRSSVGFQSLGVSGDSLSACSGGFWISRPRLPISVADVNGDGLNDVVWLWDGYPAGLFMGQVLYDDFRSFALRGGTTSPITLVQEPSGFGSGTPWLAIGDLDADGLQDLLISSGGTHVYRNLGGGTPSYAAPDTLSANQAMLPPWIGDHDGDSDQDIVLVDDSGPVRFLTLFENQGAAGFLPILQVATAASVEQIGIADFDGDLAPEYYWVTESAGVRFLYRGEIGAGTTLPIVVGPLPGTGSGPFVSHLPFDANGDGRSDLMVYDATPGDSRLRVYPNGWSTGVLIAGGASPLIRDCVIRCGDGVLVPGGGVRVDSGSPLFTGCELSQNASEVEGGGVAVMGGTAAFDHCSFSGNSAPSGAAVAELGGTATVTNSVIWGNDGAPLFGSPSLTWSDVEGGFLGLGNLAIDPLFVAPHPPGLNEVAGDVHLLSGSPCAGAGSLGTDMGAYDAPFTLSVEQPIPTGLDIVHSGGSAGHLILFVVTLDTANASGGLGSGWFAGLHVPVVDVIAAILTPQPPFQDSLDASGSASFSFLPGTVSPLLSGLTVYAVSHSFDPVFGHVSAVTAPVAYTLQ